MEKAENMCYQKLWMAMQDMRESDIKWPHVAASPDGLVSCLCLLWDMWDQVPLHSQEYDTGGLCKNLRKLVDEWRTGTGTLPWQQPSSAVSVACLQSQVLWFHSLVSSTCCHSQHLGQRVLVSCCCQSDTFSPHHEGKKLDKQYPTSLMYSQLD